MAKNSKKNRDSKKANLEEAVKLFPGLSEKLQFKEAPTKVMLEEKYPNLHHVILDIATRGAGTSERRREDLFRSVRTLNDLHRAISDLGFKLSRSSLYNRLQPKSEKTSEGKRHVSSVPVRYVTL